MALEWQDLLIDSYERVPAFLEEVVKGLSDDDLRWQPRHNCNSIGWIIWHLTRQQDAQIASLTGDEQLWTKEEWPVKFHRVGAPEDTGFGHTPEQVSAFEPPNVQTLLDYHRAVLERTKRYISSLSASDLDRELNEPWYQPLPTVGVRLISLLADNLQHVGQMAYVRGLLQGRGWQSY